MSTTKMSVEEIANSVAAHAHPTQRDYVKEATLVALTTLLTRTKKEKEEAVREERNRIAALCYQLDTDGKKMYHLIFDEDNQ